MAMLAKVTKVKKKEEEGCALVVYETTETGWGPELVEQEENQVMRSSVGGRTGVRMKQAGSGFIERSS